MADSPERVATRPSGPPLDGKLIYIEDEQRLAYGAGEQLENVPKMSEVGGGGAGDMLAANNLSEVDPVEARSNLGLGSAAVESASAFDPAGAAADALIAAKAYTDAQIANVEGGGIPEGDVHLTGKVVVPATFGPKLVFEGDEGSGFGYRQAGMLSAYINDSEFVRLSNGNGVESFAGFTNSGPYQAQIQEQVALADITLSTTGAATESGSVIPLNSKIEALLVSIPTAIVGSASISVKITGGNNFVQIGTETSELPNLGAGSHYVLVPAAFADQFNESPATLTVMASGGTPTAGMVRVKVVHRKYVVGAA